MLHPSFQGYAAGARGAGRVIVRICAAGLVLAFSAGCGAPSDGEARTSDEGANIAIANDSAPPAATDGTSTPPETTPHDTIAPGTLVDATIPAPADEPESWGYRVVSEVDVDGDGSVERVVLTARVEMVRGRPAWDDGQPWAIYIVEDDGRRVDVYRQRLQLGHLIMRLTEDGDVPRIVMIEHLPDRLRLFEASYDGENRVSVREIYSAILNPLGEAASPHLP